ncbi:MAG: hypothetical protein J5965_04070 [Aeriscardovia sp.]|nr:hypothetical protein [Aeriscardovia sp.]
MELQMNNCITLFQAKQLRQLGFNEYVSSHYWLIKHNPLCLAMSTPDNWNDSKCFVSAPTVDETIDWLRRKYNIHIYTCIEPFVDPKDPKGSVLYRYGVKWCDKNNGWNGRIVIGKTNLSKNPYSLKRQAITFALRWITKNNVKKLSK